MREKWKRVYKSSRWDVRYNTCTFVWRIKKFGMVKNAPVWKGVAEFVARGLSRAEKVEVPEALWFEVMTGARENAWRTETVEEGPRRENVEEEGPGRGTRSLQELLSGYNSPRTIPELPRIDWNTESAFPFGPVARSPQGEEL